MRSKMDGDVFAELEREVRRLRPPDAYELAKADGKANSQQGFVLGFIMSNPGCTREDIATKTGIRLQSVCARVRTLVRHGKIGIAGTTTSPTSLKEVEMLEAG